MSNPEQLAKIAEKVLNDPVLLRKISDRIYELMQEETYNHRERTGDFKRKW